MLFNKAYRYELNPNNKQIRLLIKSCGASRFAWNWGLARRKELYKNNRRNEKYISTSKLDKELNQLKKTNYQWMYEVSKCTTQQSLRDLDQAFINMMRRIKNHEKKISEPKFKKKGIHDSFRIENDNWHQRLQLIEINENYIRLPKLGFIKTKETTNKLDGRILNATISREADRWFCSLCVEVDIPTSKHVIHDIVGIDLGIKSFATISNGITIEDRQSPKPLRKNIKKAKRLHRRLDKKKKGSKNRKKARLRLARLYLRIKNIRKDFLAKLSSELAKTKSVIVIEDLNVQGMLRNHHLARSVGDEGWGTFRKMLEYKTQWYSSKLVVIPRFEPSSKRCNHCGVVNKDLKLSDRTWVCLNCGAINERDPNASKNIRDKGIEMLSTDSLSGFQACGVDVRPSYAMAVDCEAGSKHTSRRG
jgi:putative transposase